VRRVISTVAGALLALAAAFPLASPAAAQGQIAWGTCAETTDFACGHLRVPLDPGGSVPGTITLSVRRHRAPIGKGRVALVALAGGPGQPANGFTRAFVELLGPVLSTHDLIVFDQRGTGTSGALSCGSFDHPSRKTPEGTLLERCAAELGPDRAFYTTADSVADIEAIREAGGYEKLILYGTSYGTKVALQFAQDHPEQVQALLLDSVVLPNGPDQMLRSTVAAVPRILHRLCSQGACRHITRTPVRDLRRLIRRMHGRALAARMITARGASRRIHISSAALLSTLVNGDMEPVLRAEFPAAVRSALDRDPAALARLVHRGNELSEGSPQEIDVPLYYATTCEEQSFPWRRSSTPRERLDEARAALGALPASTLGPFTPEDILQESDMPACAHWPFASASPERDDAPLPNVPTLILSGSEDLRTPTADARALAAEIPDSHLLVVPGVGHSVLGSDRGPCARDALEAFFAARPIRPCSAERMPALQHPFPLAPTRLSELAGRSHGEGRAEQTLRAVALTVRECNREISVMLSTGFERGIGPIGPLRTGGLRAGWAIELGRSIVFHDYSYIPGVKISGTFGVGHATLRVSGHSAAHGTVYLGPGEALRGVLEGRSVSLPRTAGATINPTR
jgi:pimeloyl-ACP methyl ester carboxylesterase